MASPDRGYLSDGTVNERRAEAHEVIDSLFDEALPALLPLLRYLDAVEAKLAACQDNLAAAARKDQ